VASVVIDAPHLAAELRRRRACRRALVERLEQLEDDNTTWVPDDIRRAPTNLLVLAAMNLTGRAPTPDA
jgi:hypothetical protein